MAAFSSPFYASGFHFFLYFVSVCVVYNIIAYCIFMKIYPNGFLFSNTGNCSINAYTFRLNDQNEWLELFSKFSLCE